MYKILNFYTKEEVSTDSFVFAGENEPWEIQMDIDEISKKLTKTILLKHHHVYLNIYHLCR